MEWWQALILGIVEGVTEYLPISSTGHLILTSWLLGMMDKPGAAEAVFTFNIVIQSGAIAAVLGLYWPRVVQMSRGVIGQDRQGRQLAINLMIAFLPAAALGPWLDGQIDQYLNGPWPVVAALFVGAWLMLAVAVSRQLQHTEHEGRDIDHITWQIALLIGLGQCVAMWPGTSRSMMTIVVAMMLGLHPKAAAEFSFLLGLVTLTAATGHRAWNHGGEMLQAVGLESFVVGILAATVSAAVAVKWFVGFLNRHGLAPFAWYRLVVAAVLAVLLGRGLLTVPAGP